MYRVFIVEDDRAIASAVVRQLESWGMETRCAQDFRQVTAEFSTYDPHLVLMDVRLPFFNGYHWCQEIRRVSKAPIIFISSASDSMNVVMAMNMGADDFIAKPFDLNVLMAKIQALLRRSYDFADSAPRLEHRGAALHPGEYMLRFQGQEIPLTKNEHRILLTLMACPGRVVSREKLMEALWATDSFVDENTLSVNVNRLRKKLDGAGLKDFIATQFGVGYVVK